MSSVLGFAQLLERDEQLSQDQRDSFLDIARIEAQREGPLPLRADQSVRSVSTLMVEFMTMKARTRISRGGQISIPAAIRRRWGTSTVALDDQGDRLVIEPAPDDPIAAAEGALAGEVGRIDIAALRQIARDTERVAEDRRGQ